MHPLTSTATAPHAPASPAARDTWRTGLTSAAAALAGNAAVLVAARSAGADMVVRREVTEPAMAIGIGTVAMMTLGPILVGTLVLLRARRWGARAWRTLAVVGLVVGVVTAPAPFTVLAGTSTQVGLAVMHLVTGLVWFAVVRHAINPRVA